MISMKKLERVTVPRIKHGLACVIFLSHLAGLAIAQPHVSSQQRQRFAAEKCHAEALFVEGKTDEAKKLLAGLADRESALMAEALKPQNVSAELTPLYHAYREQSQTPQTLHTKKTEIVLPETKISVFVAPDGKAENLGTPEQPFATLQQARDAIRKLKRKEKEGINIFIRGGVYPMTETFVLEKQDSGVIYRAYNDEKPVFTGGVSVTGFKKVDDQVVLKRLPHEALGKVFVADVPENVAFPPVQPRGYGRNGLDAPPFVELFIDDKPQQIARWPNAPKPGADGASINNALEESERAFVRTGKVHRGFFDTKDSDQPGIFEYADPRHERWAAAKDVMLFGYWGHLWGITSCRIESIDAETKQVVLATNNPYGYRENMLYYAFNLLEEIDVPGEWYLDRENRKLYVYPPDGVDLNVAKVRLPAFSQEFLRLKDVSDVAFVGLTFEEGAGNGARVSGGERVRFLGCRFDRFGNWGLGLDGLAHVVFACDFTALGGGGIHLKGGDITTLLPGRCEIENSVVHDFSRVDRAYAPAVLMDGVGNRLAHNLFCDSPGHAIRVEGMEHTIEFNEVHSIVYESDDQSGIDIWGNPFIRGMVFRCNYWHHIGSGRDVAGQAGIRLDDMISSVLIYGNVFFRSSGGHFGGVQIHGGKDNIVDGNLMIDCKYAVSFSPWGEKRWLEMLDGHFGTLARQRGFNPDSELYRETYPDYAELKINADRNFITRNAAIGCDQFAFHGDRNVFLENVMLPWMPDLFTETKGMEEATGKSRVSPEARRIRDRLSIPENSPLYRLLGIPPLPISQMGLYRDAFRREIPKYAVTPFFVLE